MKKIIVTIMVILLMMSLTSCGETRSTTKTVTAGDSTVRVTERVIKNDEVIEETHYTINYETAEEAWTAVYGK